MHVKSDLCVVGSDPESADMTNPYGHVYGEVYFLIAEREDGKRMIGPVVESHDLDRQVNLAQTAIDQHGFDPEAEWTEGRPCYGSPYYVQSGAEQAELERELREDH